LRFNPCQNVDDVSESGRREVLAQLHKESAEMTQIFVWRLEDIFGLIALSVILLAFGFAYVESKIRQWRKKK
jgi:hypothetical protein